MKQNSLFVISLLTLVLAVACVNLDEIVITTPDLSKIADGAYLGNSKVGPVKVTLVVNMHSGAMTSIQIIEHRNGLGKKAEAIVSRVIDAQSLNVDVVSGATASSKAILLAVENALTGKTNG